MTITRIWPIPIISLALFFSGCTVQRPVSSDITIETCTPVATTASVGTVATQTVSGIIASEEPALSTTLHMNAMLANTTPSNKPSLDTYGAAAAQVDGELTISDMLRYALEDEYLAHGEYDAILKAFGNQRPFTNIINAEQTHINLLLPLFNQYDAKAPVDPSAELAVVPGSIKEAFLAGVQAEIHNIGMYDRFLKEALPDDVKTVFLELRSASQNHLNAFQRGQGGR